MLEVFAKLCYLFSKRIFKFYAFFSKYNVWCFYDAKGRAGLAGTYLSRSLAEWEGARKIVIKDYEILSRGCIYTNRNPQRTSWTVDSIPTYWHKSIMYIGIIHWIAIEYELFWLSDWLSRLSLPSACQAFTICIILHSWQT